MRRARLTFALVLCLAPLACGGAGTSDEPGTNAGHALSYFPADAGFIVLVSTDLDSDAVDELEEKVVPVESILREGAKAQGLSYDDDVEPLLGNDLVVGTLAEGDEAFDDTDEGDIVGALDVGDADRLRSTLGKLKLTKQGEERGAEIWARSGDDELAAVDGDILLVASERSTLVRALEERDANDHLTEEVVTERLAGLSADAPVRAFGDIAAVRDMEALERFQDVRWVQALESFGVTLSAGDDELRLDVAATTDASRLTADDLPLSTGTASPPVVIREHEISAANRDQSRTTVFLLRALRSAYPDAKFVRTVDRVERELGIDFEDEVLRQFNGPSASYVSPDGQTFAARSEVRDPAALERVLPRLAPHLPALIDGLQGLQSEGMALLFLFAPDAPLLGSSGVLYDIRVQPPTEPHGLYHVTGLTGAGPSEMWFGVIGDVFVVASDEQRAREIADAPTESVDSATGAGVVRADLGKLAGGGRAEFGLARRFGELIASVEASTEQVRLRVRVKMRGGPALPFFGG